MKNYVHWNTRWGAWNRAMKVAFDVGFVALIVLGLVWLVTLVLP